MSSVLFLNLQVGSMRACRCFSHGIIITTFYLFIVHEEGPFLSSDGLFLVSLVLSLSGRSYSLARFHSLAICLVFSLSISLSLGSWLIFFPSLSLSETPSPFLLHIPLYPQMLLLTLAGDIYCTDLFSPQLTFKHTPFSSDPRVIKPVDGELLNKTVFDLEDVDNSGL